MMLLDAPGTGCSGSSVVARPDPPEGNKGGSSCLASEMCRLLVVTHTVVDRGQPEDTLKPSSVGGLVWPPNGTVKLLRPKKGF